MVQRFTPGWEADLWSFQMSSVRAGARRQRGIKRQPYSLLISAFLIYSQYIFFFSAASVARLNVFFRGIPFEVYLT